QTIQHQLLITGSSPVTHSTFCTEQPDCTSSLSPACALRSPSPKAVRVEAFGASDTSAEVTKSGGRQTDQAHSHVRLQDDPTRGRARIPGIASARRLEWRKRQAG